MAQRPAAGRNRSPLATTHRLNTARMTDTILNTKRLNGVSLVAAEHDDPLLIYRRENGGRGL
jgi:hypothetical protein